LFGPRRGAYRRLLTGADDSRLGVQLNRAIKWKPRNSRLHDFSGRSCAEPRAPRYIRTLCEDAALYAPSRAWATVEGGPRHSPHAAALGLPRVTVLGVEASVDIVFGAQGVSP
jgi:hypothetical protein